MRNIKTELTELLGFPPCRELKTIILREAKESGRPIAEIADKYALPPMFILDDEGMIIYKGQRMTSQQFSERFPFRRFVTIGTKELQKKKRTNI